VDPLPPSNGPNGATPVNRAIIAWEDGVPVMRSVPMLTRQQITDIALAAAATIYEPDPTSPGDQQYANLTCLEVMLIKQAQAAARSGSGVESILDRLAGRPKTTAEVHSISETYEDVVKRIAQSEAIPTTVAEEDPLDGLR
jgi:hypothetical protein